MYWLGRWTSHPEFEASSPSQAKKFIVVRKVGNDIYDNHYWSKKLLPHTWFIFFLTRTSTNKYSLSSKSKRDILTYAVKVQSLIFGTILSQLPNLIYNMTQTQVISGNPHRIFLDWQLIKINIIKLYTELQSNAFGVFSSGQSNIISKIHWKKKSCTFYFRSKLARIHQFWALYAPAQF